MPETKSNIPTEGDAGVMTRDDHIHHRVSAPSAADLEDVPSSNAIELTRLPNGQHSQQHGHNGHSGHNGLDHEVADNDKGEENLHEKLLSPNSALGIDLDDDDDDNNNGKSHDDSHRHHQHKEDGHGSLPPGSASTTQLIINIVISFIGAGILGIPYAMRQAGWLLGSITLLVISALNLYAMLLLPQIKAAIMSGRGTVDAQVVHTYGDVGRCLLGPRGETFVNVCLGISQAGFATAYVIFIAANIHKICGLPRSVVCAACIPGLAGLVQFRSMTQLAPFSLLANVSNFLALSAVLFHDFEAYEPHNDTIHPVKWKGFIYVVAVTLYSMEGIGLILSLQSSAANQSKFNPTLTSVITCISIFMAFFGTMGYWAFGDQTEAPITGNLTGHWSSTVVKLALSLGLYLTYPIMMFPIWSISETIYPVLSESTSLRIAFRGLLVLMSVCVAWLVPNFGEFLSLVGSSICNVLGFILPCYFHLRVFGKEVTYTQAALDYFLMIGGVLFGIVGTYNSFMAMLHPEELHVDIVANITDAEDASNSTGLRW